MESTESMTLLEGAGVYLESFKGAANHAEVQRELFRFVHWCGLDRAFAKLDPPAIGEYAEQMAGTGAAAQAEGRLQIIRDFLAYSKKKGLIDQNLARHVRVRKSKGRASKRKVQDPTELTAQGHAQLVAELEKLKSSRGPLALQIQKAAADKDVRENVPLEAAREQLGHVESRIRSLEGTLRSSVIIDASSQVRLTTAKLGTRVSVKELTTGRETSYLLVGRTEANPLEGKISDVSPLGKALLGRTPGQEVEVETPRGKMHYRILEVGA